MLLAADNTRQGPDMISSVFTPASDTNRLTAALEAPLSLFPCLGGFNPVTNHDPAAYCQQMIGLYPGWCGIGEVHLLSSVYGVAENLLTKKWTDFFTTSVGLKLPVWLHWDITYSPLGTTPDDLLLNLLTLCNMVPAATIIWTHCDAYPVDWDFVAAKAPNLYWEWELWRDGRIFDPAVLTKHAERIVLGTDTGAIVDGGLVSEQCDPVTLQMKWARIEALLSEVTPDVGYKLRDGNLVGLVYRLGEERS